MPRLVKKNKKCDDMLAVVIFYLLFNWDNAKNKYY